MTVLEAEEVSGPAKKPSQQVATLDQIAKEREVINRLSELNEAKRREEAYQRTHELAKRWSWVTKAIVPVAVLFVASILLALFVLFANKLGGDLWNATRW